MFVNVSNHPSKNWGKIQISEARKYGEIIDIPFPAVDPKASKEDVYHKAELCVKEILNKSPKCVLCQGEFCLTNRIVELLKAENILVVAACSERKVVEYNQDGVDKKEVIFEFVKYREY